MPPVPRSPQHDMPWRPFPLLLSVYRSQFDPIDQRRALVRLLFTRFDTGHFC